MKRQFINLPPNKIQKDKHIQYNDSTINDFVFLLFCAMIQYGRENT